MSDVRYVRSFDGTSLFTEAQGEGPAVVLCDGLGCAGFIWKYLMPELSRRYQVIHPHYRAHGKSDAPKGEKAMGVSALRNDLSCVLEAYGVQRAAFIGHSMGAQIVFDYAIAYPEKVTGVVSLCGSYGRPLDTLRGNKALGTMFPLLRATLVKFPSAAERFWQWFFSTELSFAYAHRFEVNEQNLVPDDFRPYFEHLSRMDPQMFVALVGQLQQHSVLEALPSLDVPALVVAAEHDTFCPADLSRRMVEALPRAQFLIVPDGSHVAPLENPDLVGEATLAFLRLQAWPRA